MNILWVSNGLHTNTGYGQSSRAVVPRMIKDGHNVAVLSYWGVQGEPIFVDDVLHLPAGSDAWGNDVIVPYFHQLKRDVVIVHRDNWVNNPEVSRAVPTACWFPVDHAPPTDLILDNAAACQWNATMSKFGVNAMLRAGYAVDYIPHGVEPDVMRYVDDKAYQRQRLFSSLPADAFLVTMVGANKGYPSRKGFVEAFQALAIAMEEDARIHAYIHTNPTNHGGGPDLQKVVKVLGMDPTRVRFLDPTIRIMGVDDEDLAAIYRASDVLLHPSYAEGFGMCIVEAQACGTPVITNASTSQPELTRFGISCAPKADFLSAHYGWWAIPDPEGLARAILGIVSQQYDKWPVQRQLASADILTDFSNDTVYERHMRPWLQKIEQQLPLRPPL